MLDAYIIDAIRDAEKRRDERSQVVLEIDPPRPVPDAIYESDEVDPDLDRGPIIIPLREDAA